MNKLLLTERKGILVADSRDVATMIEKPHSDLMKSVRQYCEYLTAGNFPLSDFFIKSKYKDSTGRTLPCFLITRKGCDMIANKLTGKKGVLFTAAYINRFYEMEEALKSRQAARMDFPQFTDTVKRIHETPKHFHFSNECDLINRIVLGMSAKQFKEANGIPSTEKSIRPFLSAEQIRLIDLMQKADIGLMVAERDFSKRKMFLEWYFNSLIQKQLAC